MHLDDANGHRFLGPVAKVPEGYGLEVHAFVLTENHYRLLARRT